MRRLLMHWRIEQCDNDGMAVEIEYSFGGRKVSERQFFDGLDGQVRKSVVDQVVAKVEQVRCPQHGQRAKVSNVQQSGDDFSFSVSGCYDDLQQRAKRAIGG